MAEKVVDKLRRLSRDLAESVRAEIEMAASLRDHGKQMSELKKHVKCYLSDREGIESTAECLTFLKGYFEAKTQESPRQMKLKFPNK